MKNFGIGYNKELDVYFSKQDIINYHKYKSEVYSDEGREWHLEMIEKIKKYGYDDYE